MDLVVRPATSADYEAVMNINRNVYDGFDYLPASYFPFLSDPRFLLLVGELNKEVVSFSAYEQLEKGNAVLGFAARVKTDVQNKGIWGSHHNKGMEMMKAQWPHVTMYVYAAGWSDFHQRFMKENQDIQRTSMSNFMGFQFSVKCLSFLPRLKPTSPADTARTVSTDVLLKQLARQESKQQIFGADQSFMFHNRWCPVSITNDNLRLAAVQCYTLVSYADNDTITALSFSSILKLPKGIRVHVSFYGSRIGALIGHIHNVLMHVQQISSEDVVKLVVLSPVSLNRKDLIQRLSPALGEPMTAPPFNQIFAASFTNSKL